MLYYICMFPGDLSITMPASILVGFFGLIGNFAGWAHEANTHLALTPTEAQTELNTPFTVTVTVASDQPVNAFQGLLQFDDQVLRVQEISYNTSIADLWVERPWYDNGDGTIHFAGGTTRPGGFQGSGNLLTITFLPYAAGDATVTFREGLVLAHDGLGTNLPVDEPVDALFTVEAIEQQARVVATSSGASRVAVSEELVDFDLNGDGYISFADVSVLLPELWGSNMRYDLNDDGTVSWSDVHLLLEQI